MADIELVIRIPEEIISVIDDKNYQNVISWYDTTLFCAIKNGTLLEHGKWISEKVDGEDWKGCKRQYYQPISCSKCHSPNHYKSTYCPNCGAKMQASPTGAERSDKE